MAHTRASIENASAKQATSPHHAHTDEEGDPHSPHVSPDGGVQSVFAGLWHAHTGWLMSSQGRADWKRWGPYLSDRQWGTVREWYDTGKDPWTDLVHDEARSRAYRWNDEGMAGVSSSVR